MNNSDYGPLAPLIGTWKGNKGTDVAPTADNSEDIPYYETIIFEAAGDVTNAGEQRLWVVRYHQVVQRTSDNEVFHDQIGYWTWDPEQQQVIQSLTIPRAVCVLAGGTASTTTNGATRLDVAAEAGSDDWGIVQSPFMNSHAKTTAYRHHLTVDRNTLTYSQSTMLDIYGRQFDHTDENTLIRSDSL